MYAASIIKLNKTGFFQINKWLNCKIYGFDKSAFQKLRNYYSQAKRATYTNLC